MANYATKAETIIDLHKRGYGLDFIILNGRMLCIQHNEFISLEELQVMETYHFSGKRKLRDNHIIYAISSIENDVKGILMTSLKIFRSDTAVSLWAKISHCLSD